jgi:hypothetical protein
MNPNNNRKRVVRIYQHSDMLYWWPVWAYGFFAAAVTRLHGVQIKVGEHHVPEWFYPSPWLGGGFIVVVLLVILVTALESRGTIVVSGGLILAVAAAVWQPTGWEFVLGTLGVSRLLIHMNLAFYVTLSLLLLLFWLLLLGLELRFPWEWDPRVGALYTRGGPLGFQRRPINVDFLDLREIRFGVDDVLAIGMTSNAMLYVRVLATGNIQAFELKNIFFPHRLLKRIVAARGIVAANVPAGAM